MTKDSGTTVMPTLLLSLPSLEHSPGQQEAHSPFIPLRIRVVILTPIYAAQRGEVPYSLPGSCPELCTKLTGLLVN